MAHKQTQGITTKTNTKVSVSRSKKQTLNSTLKGKWSKNGIDEEGTCLGDVKTHKVRSKWPINKTYSSISSIVLVLLF